MCFVCYIVVVKQSICAKKANLLSLDTIRALAVLCNTQIAILTHRWRMQLSAVISETWYVASVNVLLECKSMQSILCVAICTESLTG